LDFIGRRLCAKKALEKLGVNEFPILMANDRSPIWPEGIAGTISHTDGYCGVAVASKRDTESLGLDIECIERLKPECYYLICTDREQSRIKHLQIEEQKRLAALMFSAKECFYKCQYFINKCWAGFHEAEIFANINNNQGEFEIVLLNDIGKYFKKNSTLKGRFLFSKGYVITGLTI